MNYPSEEELLITIKKFEPKIKKSLQHTNHQNREDLEQEIHIKIIEKLTTVEFEQSPSFWDLIEK